MNENVTSSGGEAKTGGKREIYERSVLSRSLVDDFAGEAMNEDLFMCEREKGIERER